MIEEKIVWAIADARDIEPTELDLTLQNWTDMDSIRQLVEHDSTNWTVQFEIPNYTVTVTGETEILVVERDNLLAC